jgi:NmrA-like family
MSEHNGNDAGNTSASTASRTEATTSTSGKPLVAVYGATSKQGRSVAVTLLASGRFRVRAITRNRDSTEARSLASLGAEIATVPSGLGHREELVTAFNGVDSVYLMTPQIDPQDDVEFALGKQLADAAVEAGVGHIIFSTLENVEKITGGKKHVPHFTSKALVADYIRSLPVSHSACGGRQAAHADIPSRRLSSAVRRPPDGDRAGRARIVVGPRPLQRRDASGRWRHHLAS